MASLAEQVEEIRTKQDLVRFLALLEKDYKENRDTWENDTLDRYLEAASSWASDMDGFFLWRNEKPPDQPTWNLIAQIFLAATIYE